MSLLTLNIKSTTSTTATPCTTSSTTSISLLKSLVRKISETDDERYVRLIFNGKLLQPDTKKIGE